MGETRRLYEGPVHVSKDGEAEELTELLSFALLLGWDAVITSKPGRKLLTLSHDDRIEVYSGGQSRSLANKLKKLGYWND